MLHPELLSNVCSVAVSANYLVCQVFDNYSRRPLPPRAIAALAAREA
jgi:hypothetical protein